MAIIAQAKLEYITTTPLTSSISKYHHHSSIKINTKKLLA